MKIEMGQHQELRTWEITELPPSRTAIGCRWVYAIKTKLDGEFEKAKARIVAQGFTQRPGMDYYDITSPVVKFDSLRVILPIANTLNWEIKMMDIKGGYLHSMLEEEIYMHQPDGFDDGSGQVLKLQQALYGLKQSGRTWHQRLHGLLLGLRFQQSLANECVYIRQDKDSIEVIWVYVDNFRLFADSKGGMIKLKGELNEKFQMTELGEMKKILGIRIERDRK